MYFLSNMGIFHCYVGLPEGTWKNCSFGSCQEQAKDTVNQLEEFGLAVKAEPIEGERSNEQECLLGDGRMGSPP